MKYTKNECEKKRKLEVSSNKTANMANMITTNTRNVIADDGNAKAAPPTTILMRKETTSVVSDSYVTSRYR